MEAGERWRVSKAERRARGPAGSSAPVCTQSNATGRAVLPLPHPHDPQHATPGWSPMHSTGWDGDGEGWDLPQGASVSIPSWVSSCLGTCPQPAPHSSICLMGLSLQTLMYSWAVLARLQGCASAKLSVRVPPAVTAWSPKASPNTCESWLLL